MRTPPRQALRDAIANTLYPTSAYELADVCESLGLAPQGDDDPMRSKMSYVNRRLRGKSHEELVELARRVAEEYGGDHIAPLLLGPVPRGADGHIKNIIFAADGAKPQIVLRDAPTNVIDIAEGAERCLVYDRPLDDEGLTWQQMVAWWAERQGLADDDVQARLSLAERLERSLANEAELHLFRTYRALGTAGPALLPQVYLHYDPFVRSRLGDRPGPLARQRMDFLLLLPGANRVVLEVDGRQHYSDQDGRANTHRYAEMVAEDRRLRLDGYEVYRFGGAELVDRVGASGMLNDFFHALFARHGVDTSQEGSPETPPGRWPPVPPY